MAWNPAIGRKAVADRLGDKLALATLTSVLRGKHEANLVWVVELQALLEIGNGHAESLMNGPMWNRVNH